MLYAGLLSLVVVVILILVARKAMAQGSNESIYYYHTDHLGTPIMLTDSNQAIAWDATYDPFGKANIVTASITNNLRFPGQYYDSESGLNYNLHRYYWAEIGRYISPDILNLTSFALPFNYTSTIYKHLDEYGSKGILLIHPEFQNSYGYSANNPNKWTDPLGLMGNRPRLPNPTPTPRGCRQCAEDIRNEGRRKFTWSPNESPKNNFMRHCWASCEVCKRCPFGPICSEVGGWYNESEGQFDWGDVGANYVGLHCCFQNKACEKCCEGSVCRMGL